MWSQEWSLARVIGVQGPGWLGIWNCGWPVWWELEPRKRFSFCQRRCPRWRGKSQKQNEGWVNEGWTTAPLPSLLSKVLARARSMYSHGHVFVKIEKFRYCDCDQLRLLLVFTQAFFLSRFPLRQGVIEWTWTVWAQK